MAVQLLDKKLVMKPRRSSVVKVQKDVDFEQNYDSDSENFVKVEEIISVDEETGEETELPAPVLKGGFSRSNKDKK